MSAHQFTYTATGRPSATGWWVSVTCSCREFKLIRNYNDPGQRAELVAQPLAHLARSRTKTTAEQLQDLLNAAVSFSQPAASMAPTAAPPDAPPDAPPSPRAPRAPQRTSSMGSATTLDEPARQMLDRIWTATAAELRAQVGGALAPETALGRLKNGPSQAPRCVGKLQAVAIGLSMEHTGITPRQLQAWLEPNTSWTATDLRRRHSAFRQYRTSRETTGTSFKEFLAAVLQRLPESDHWLLQTA